MIEENDRTWKEVSKILESWSRSEREKRSKKCDNPKGFTMRQFCKNRNSRSKRGQKKN